MRMPELTLFLNPVMQGWSTKVRVGKAQVPHRRQPMSQQRHMDLSLCRSPNLQLTASLETDLLGTATLRQHLRETRAVSGCLKQLYTGKHSFLQKAVPLWQRRNLYTDQSREQEELRASSGHSVNWTHVGGRKKGTEPLSVHRRPLHEVLDWAEVLSNIVHKIHTKKRHRAGPPVVGRSASLPPMACCFLTVHSKRPQPL